MTNTERFAAAAMLVVALGITGCGSADPAAVAKAGFSPLPTPDTTLTCYDYNGNVTLKEKPTDGASFYSYEIQARYKEGKTTHILGGSCISQEFRFNINDPASAARFEEAGRLAPYFAVVTNGVDKVLLSGRFTDVDVYSDGRMTLQLEKDGVVLQKVEVSGLQVTATAQQGAIPDYVANPQKLPSAP